MPAPYANEADHLDSLLKADCPSRRQPDLEEADLGFKQVSPFSSILN
jgi:hypothetical protein